MPFQSAFRDSIDALAARISGVRYAPLNGLTDDTPDAILFELDGKPYRGLLTGRNRDFILNGSQAADCAIAIRVFLDGAAAPFAGA